MTRLELLRYIAREALVIAVYGTLLLSNNAIVHLRNLDAIEEFARLRPHIDSSERREKWRQRERQTQELWAQSWLPERMFFLPPPVDYREKI